MKTLLELDAAGSERAFEALGGRAFHARIARQQVFGAGQLDYAQMTGLPAALRARLTAELPILAGLEQARSRSTDGTCKLLIAFPARAAQADGPARRASAIETVHLPSSTPGKAATLCVSTQAGCPVGCPFCASGLAGLERNLAAHEILEQFVRGRALGPLARSVVMGMGEPLLNLAALTEALEVVHSEMGLGARAITVSTVGFPERLRRAAEAAPRFQLAVSLHTPDQAQRDELVPAMRGVPIQEVLAAADHWFERTGREVTYEYALLGGLNDSPGHADRLAARLARRRCTVNLIPWNPVAAQHGETAAPAAPRFARPSAPAVEDFAGRLRAHGLVCTVRWSKGVQADAACGQLRLREQLSPRP